MLVARLARLALAARAARLALALAASAGGCGGRLTALEVAAAPRILRCEVGVGALLRLAIDFEQRAWLGSGLGLRGRIKDIGAGAGAGL